jgi:hypothetical protein
MEHRGLGFDDWWEANQDWYLANGITKRILRPSRSKTA